MAYLKIFIIAGEASGDLHGKNLIKAIYERNPNCHIKAYGGTQMESAGAEIVRNYGAFNFMGFYEVARNIRKVLSNIKITEKIILDFQPDIVIFIDFPGFNLRVAKNLRPKLSNTKFYYYIAPQVWAWKSGRVHKLNQIMDKIFVILPFEKPFFAGYGYDVDYVGHPLLDEIGERSEKEKSSNLIAILPGSRQQEIKKMLPTFIELASLLPAFQFEISTMKEIPMAFYEEIKGQQTFSSNIKYSDRSTYDLLETAHIAIVTSGTATLETALLKTPQIVAYKTSPISYWIAKKVVNVKYISLVNLILDKEAIKELIQDDLNIKNLIHEIRLLTDSKVYDRILYEYAQLKLLLGNGDASKRVAELIFAKDN